MAERTESSIHVDAKPGVVLDVIADFEAYPEWAAEVAWVADLRTSETTSSRTPRATNPAYAASSADPSRPCGSAIVASQAVRSPVSNARDRAAISVVNAARAASDASDPALAPASTPVSAPPVVPVLTVALVEGDAGLGTQPDSTRVATTPATRAVTTAAPCAVTREARRPSTSAAGSHLPQVDCLPNAVTAPMLCRHGAGRRRVVRLSRPHGPLGPPDRSRPRR